MRCEHALWTIALVSAVSTTNTTMITLAATGNNRHNNTYSGVITVNISNYATVQYATKPTGDDRNGGNNMSLVLHAQGVCNSCLDSKVACDSNLYRSGQLERLRSVDHSVTWLDAYSRAVHV